MDATRKLQELFADDWKSTLDEYPELATYVGAVGHDNRWTDWSATAMERRKRRRHELLARIQAIDRSALGSAADRLDHDLFVRRTCEEIESHRFPDECMPLNQMHGLQQDAGRLIGMMPAFSVENYENIIARLRAMPRLVSETIALMERGLSTGIVAPRVAIRDVPRQIREQIEVVPEKSLFLSAFDSFPESIPAARREKLRKAARDALTAKTVPAYRRLQDFIEKQYLPATRAAIGLSCLPDGEAWYEFKIRSYTTTARTARELHDLGLEEVRRIRSEMDRTIAATGFRGTFEAFGKFLRTDKRFYHTTPGALVAEYRDICKRIEPGLVKIFGRLPRLPYGVTEVPAHAAKSAPTAYYMPGSLEAGRPGWYLANTYNLKARPRWEMEALTLHEAVPGHHLQISLARELTGVPEFRRHDMPMAFIEGWALYAESLGEALGLYKDPYSKIGQLSYEIWRACRLVVDTGIHAFGWSRAKAIAYLTSNSCKLEHDAKVEIDRYIAIPGQALAYKVGELTLRALRSRAQATLGARFDLRAFHDALLENGSLPLDIAESQIAGWIASRTG